MKFGRSKSVFFQAALFAVTVGMLVYFCVSGNNLMLLLKSLPGLSLLWLLGSLFCTAGSWMVETRILQLLLRSAGKDPCSFWKTFQAVMTGLYFGAVTPFAVAGQPMQFLALTRQGVPSGRAVSALAQKFLVYQTTLVVLSAGILLLEGGFFSENIPGIFTLACVAFAYQSAAIVLLFFFTHNRKVTTGLIHWFLRVLTKIRLVRSPEKVEETVNRQLEFYLEANRTMHKDHKTSFQVYGWTVLQQLLVFSVPFFLYKAFSHPGFPVVDMISSQCVVTMLSACTPLPGAAGAAEGSFLGVFRLFFQEDVLQQAMLLWRLITYYSCIVVGVFFAGSLRKKDQKGRKAALPGQSEPFSGGSV